MGPSQAPRRSLVLARLGHIHLCTFRWTERTTGVIEFRRWSAAADRGPKSKRRHTKESCWVGSHRPARSASEMAGIRLHPSTLRPGMAQPRSACTPSPDSRQAK